MEHPGISLTDILFFFIASLFNPIMVLLYFFAFGDAIIDWIKARTELNKAKAAEKIANAKKLAAEAAMLEQK